MLRVANIYLFNNNLGKQTYLSFHGNTLCQVSRLVDVATSADGYVVGEELEGDYF